VQAKEGVIDHLNTVLTNELTAINQYFLQAKMCAHWGYDRLHDKFRELSMGEMNEADEVISHILYLDGLPNLQRLGRIGVGENVLEDLELALALENNQINALTEAITHCSQVGDYATRSILEGMVRGEADDADWLETQLETIKQVGLERYLTQQIKS
jgi:bacterioferritin